MLRYKRCEATLLAVANGRHLINDLRSQRGEWNSMITARRDADVLINIRFNAQLLQRELGITTGNARRYIDPLAAAGIIVEFTDRAHNRAWRSPAVLGHSTCSHYAQVAARNQAREHSAPVGRGT